MIGMTRIGWLVSTLVFLVTPLYAQTDAYMEKGAMKRPPKEFSPYVNRGFPTPLWSVT